MTKYFIILKMTEGAHFNSAFDFGYTSFVFSAITGFCIGGSALANIIGMGYLNKRLSMTNALIISVVFETIGNLFLSRYILKATITKTIRFEIINKDLLKEGVISLASTIMCSALMMVNVTIFALPMSSTQIVFSGLTGIAIVFLSESNGNSLVDVKWVSLELMFWVLTPIFAMLISWGMWTLIETKIYKKRNARISIIKMIPY